MFEGFKRVFLVLLRKESPYLSALSRSFYMKFSSKMVNNLQNIHFFIIVCKFLPHTGHLSWKVLSTIILTFYLKYQKCPFCAPIFYPIYETKSYNFLEFIDKTFILPPPKNTILLANEFGCQKPLLQIR